ncbi:hypothetical protein [Streptomyces sp. NPDC055189]
MDPVSVGLLAALAGGAGGELGRQAWAGLTALVRRPLRRDHGDDVPGVSSGQAELAQLTQEPTNLDRASALSTALAMRAALDGGFRAGLEGWHAQTSRMCVGGGEVNNTISGGTQHGPVLQGRDYFGPSFPNSPVQN